MTAVQDMKVGTLVLHENSCLDVCERERKEKGGTQKEKRRKNKKVASGNIKFHVYKFTSLFESWQSATANTATHLDLHSCDFFKHCL